MTDNIEKNEALQVVDIKDNFTVRTKDGEIYTLKYPNDGQLELFEIKRKQNTVINRQQEIKYSEADPKAMLWFFSLLYLEGKTADGTEIKKEKVPALKQEIIAKALWSNGILYPYQVIERYGSDVLVKDDDNEVFYLEVIHGKKRLTVHVLKQPSESDLLEWKLLIENETNKLKEKKLVQIPGNKNRGKISLYNKLFIRAVGYAGNEVDDIPGTHKLEVITDLFTVTQDQILDLD